MMILRPAALCVFTLLTTLASALNNGSSTTVPSRLPSPNDPNLVRPRLEQLTLSPDFEITDKPTTRNYNFTISMQTGAPDGFFRQMLVVNGQYPGPTIEANEGDTIVVHVKNELQVGTSVHWHGMNQNGTAWMDGPAGITQCPIPAGGSFTYIFRIERQFGTYWWHAHAGGQVADGVQGALIVHSVRDPLKRGVHYDYDQVLLMGDWYHNTSIEIMDALDTPQGYQGFQAAPPPISAMFNGFGTWNCTRFGTPGTCFNQRPYELQVFPNKRYRLRYINSASHGMIYNSVDNHTLDVIEADDIGVSNPAINDLHRVQLHNGQRYSAVLTTDQGKPGDAFWMRARLHDSCFRYTTPETNNVTLAIIRYVDEQPNTKPTTNLPTTQDWTDTLGSDCRDLNTSALTPILRDDPPVQISQQGMFSNQFNIVNTTAGSVTRFFVNNVTWNHLWYRPVLYDVISGRGVNNSNIADISFDQPEGADIIVNNLDPIEHPYHLHGMVFWIVGEGPGALTLDAYRNTTFNTNNPIRRDTHTVPGNSWSVLRIRADNPGVWLMHCHIDFHLGHGFAAAVVVQPNVVRTFQVPEKSSDLCKHIPPGLNADSTLLGPRSIGSS